MVVLAKGELEQIALPAAVQKAAPPLADVPEVDLGGGACRADAARAVVAACEGHGFFKVTGHGVPAGLLARVEAAAAAFFAMAQPEKEAAAAAAAEDRLQRGPRYLLLGVAAAAAAPLPAHGEASPSPSYGSFRDILNEYVVAVRAMMWEVLKLMAEGLGLKEKDALVRLVSHEESDSVLRVNHYPPHPELKQQGHGRLTGFGEHTDPQIISVLRSNDTSGLEISLRDGSWASVPPDRKSATREATRSRPAAGLLSLASPTSPPPEQPPAKPDGGKDGGGGAFYPLQHPAVGAPMGNRRRGGDALRRLRRRRRPEAAEPASLLADLAPSQPDRDEVAPAALHQDEALAGAVVAPAEKAAGWGSRGAGGGDVAGGGDEAASLGAAGSGSPRPDPTPAAGPRRRPAPGRRRRR
uniref:Fe2OG dioxygenase domain-containing protein n=1 Tax=Oryza rufipogon TaxID=4529 RepID=A0A0E0PIV9_ORYRU